MVSHGQQWRCLSSGHGLGQLAMTSVTFRGLAFSFASSCDSGHIPTGYRGRGTGVCCFHGSVYKLDCHDGREHMGCELVEPGIYLAKSEKIANTLTPPFFSDHPAAVLR